MTEATRAALVRQLVRHEGLRLLPYKDSVGLLTIGVGRNLEHRGITEDEAYLLLNNDIDLCLRQLAAQFPWFQELDPVRQRAMIDLCFNMGMPTLLQFTSTLGALARGDYEAAGNHLKRSKWYGQVGSRGPRIVKMIVSGQEG